MAIYVGLIRRRETGFTVTFPDFPTLVVSAATSISARLGAQDLLQCRIAAMRRRREEPPAPMPIAYIVRDPRNRDAVPMLIRVVPEVGRMRQIS